MPILQHKNCRCLEVMSIPLFIFVLLIFIMLSNIGHAQVIINEFMYNPSEDLGGTYNEWIELYNYGNESINISGWRIADPSDHVIDTNNSLIPAKGYFVIAKNITKFLQYYNIDCSISKAGFYLNNGGETILLKDSNGSVIDNVTYTNDYANGNGMTIERISSSKSFGESLVYGGTPGKQNSLYGSCDFSVGIDSEGVWQITNDSAAVKWKIDVKDNTKNNSSFSFSYWIEDVYGNIIKNPYTVYDNETGSFGYYQKTFHNDDAGGYIIKANLTSDCNDLTQNNNIASKAIIIKSKQGSETANSDIGILSATRDNNIIKAKVYVFRNDTRRYAVYVYAKKDNRIVSEKTTIYVYTKFMNQTLVVPVFLTKCYNATYNIIIAGLDMEKQKPFDVACDIDQTEERKDKQTTEKSNKNQPVEINTIISNATSNTIKLDETGAFDIIVKLININNNEKDVSVYGYLYKGSKCYSCINGLTRESNKVNIKLKANNTKRIILSNIARAPNGNYKYKVIINDGKKQVYRHNVTILNINKNLDKIFRLVYETRTEKLSQSKVMLIAIITLLLIIIIFKKVI